MNIFKLVLLSILTLSVRSIAHADLSVSIAQVGPSVVVNSQGTIDTSSLWFTGEIPFGAFMRAFPDGTRWGPAGMLVGPPSNIGASPMMDHYIFYGSSGPVSFGTSASVVAVGPDSGTGDAHGVFSGINEAIGEFEMWIVLPQGYQSGDSLQSEMIFANTTIAALGINADTYQWSAGGNSIVLSVFAPELPGDVNQDGVVNFLDISPFIAILSAGGYLAEADINGDDAVNFFDISPFIDLLSS